MNKGTVSFLLAMALFVTVAVTWSKAGGLAAAFQEKNLQDWADRTPQFVQTTECESCHKTIYTMWVGGKHKTVNCQTCHGPAEEHIVGPLKPTVDTSRELCANCHNQITGRRADFPTVDVQTHQSGQPCITCHNNHAPGTPRPGGK